MKARGASEPGPRSRFSRQAREGMRLTERDADLLCGTFLHRALTSGQLEALYFGSRQRANTRLRLLYDHGYLLRHFPAEAPYGAQASYSIAAKAVPVVSERLGLEERQVRDLTRKSPTPLFRAHAAAVADFRLALRDASTEDARVLEFAPEILCRQEYDIRPRHGGPWRREVFRPDGYFRLETPEGKADFFLEMDMGHASRSAIRDKLEGFATFLETGMHREIYGDAPAALLVVTTGPMRRDRLASYAEAFSRLDVRLAAFGEIRARGAFAPVWRRAGDGVTGLADARAPPGPA